MSASNNLIKEFCLSIGMEGLGLDDDKQRSLCFDDNLVLTFLTDDIGDILTCLCYVGEADTPEQLRKLLEQNFLAEANGGARFALEPNSNRTVMTRIWDAPATSVPAFSSDIEAFVNSGMIAKNFLENGVAASPAVAPASASTADSLSNAHLAI